MNIIENTNMRCPNCSENKWQNVDEFRIKESGMGLCVSCGFISYPTKYKSSEEIKKHYRSSYRNPPTHANMFTCERKNHFHNRFLSDLFKKWKDEGLENPVIGEIGSAFGFTLQWIKSIFPKAEVYGTELTTSFRRNAFHEFGITLAEDLDETKKYDLIISYKVLEHQLDPDIELKRYAKLLNTNGVLYISVPTWFNSLINFGLNGFDLEYYFEPNHINVWTKEMFENMASRAGFEEIKSDQIIYSSTYLYKVNQEKTSPHVLKLNPNDILEKLKKIKEAFFELGNNQFQKAIEIWPDFPQAHVSHAEVSRKLLTEKGWAKFKTEIIEPAIKACPTSTEIINMATDFALRAQEFPTAVKYAELGLKMKPENPVSLHQLMNCMREIAIKAQDMNEKLHYFFQAREIARHLRHTSTQHFKEATDMIYFFNSKIPFKGETIKKPSAPVEPLKLVEASP